MPVLIALGQVILLLGGAAIADELIKDDKIADIIWLVCGGLSVVCVLAALFMLRDWNRL